MPAGAKAMRPLNNRVLKLIVASLVVVTSLATAYGERARFELTVNNTWSTTTHPGLFPDGAHFSWLAGGTHDSSVHFWRNGELASPGVTQMAETGFTTGLVDEINAAASAGQAHGSVLGLVVLSGRDEQCGVLRPRGRIRCRRFISVGDVGDNARPKSRLVRGSRQSSTDRCERLDYESVG